MEKQEHFNKRMVQRVRRILRETEQYKAELFQHLCEQNGFVVSGKYNRLVNVDYMLNRVEKEDIPYTFMYSADKTYVFGDLLVSLTELHDFSYYTVWLKPPLFDLTEWLSSYQSLETYLKQFESKN